MAIYRRRDDPSFAGDVCVNEIELTSLHVLMRHNRG
jgi:hypothetical protein